MWRVESDARCVEVNVSFAKVPGYHVALDVEIPIDALYAGKRPDGGPMGCLRLTADKADALARSLSEAGQRARELSGRQSVE
jgi:hypothetical protein